MKNKRKRARIRRMNLTRNDRTCRNMIGFIIDNSRGLMVRDQAKIKGNTYLLVKSELEYAIFRVLDIGQYEEVPARKMSKNQDRFSNHNTWRRHSTIEFTEDGEILTVRHGDFWGPYNRRTYGIKVKL